MHSLFCGKERIIMDDKEKEELELENERLREENERLRLLEEYRKTLPLKERLYDRIDVSVKTMDIIIAGLLILLAVVMIIALTTGCTINAQSTAVTSETQAEMPKQEENIKPEPVSVGVCIYDFKDDFMKIYRDELTKYLTETYGARVYTRDARNMQTNQDFQINALISRGIDVMIVDLVNTDSAASVVSICERNGIPLVFINREPDASEIERWEEEKINVSYIGTDAKQAGVMQGEIILDTSAHGDVNGDGTVSYAMIMGEAGNIDADFRTEYPIKTLEAAGYETEEVFREYGNWKKENGYLLASRALSENGDKIEVIFCNNDAMAIGAMRAVGEAGRTVGEDIYLVGVDALREAVSYVKDGMLTGTILNDYVKQSHTAADTAMNLLHGEHVDKTYQIDYIKIVLSRLF